MPPETVEVSLSAANAAADQPLYPDGTTATHLRLRKDIRVERYLSEV